MISSWLHKIAFMITQIDSIMLLLFLIYATLQRINTEVFLPELRTNQQRQWKIIIFCETIILNRPISRVVIGREVDYRS